MKITVGQLRKLVREAVEEIGGAKQSGWDPKADYDMNKWNQLVTMLPGMEEELQDTLEMIKVEAPKINQTGARYTVDGLTKKIVGDLGLPPDGKERQAIRDVVHHLARLQPVAGYSHVPGGESFPRGRGGPGDTRGT